MPESHVERAGLTAVFDYVLDPGLIATAPTKERDQSRLLVYDRKTSRMTHDVFSSLASLLTASDLLVFNNTRVYPARLRAQDGAGKPIEMLFLRPTRPGFWAALVRGKARGPLTLGPGAVATPTGASGEGGVEVAVALPPAYPDLYAFLAEHGEVPLPPYILKKRRGEQAAFDLERYQTVYAQMIGSAAAPTAGLHFTPGLLARLAEKGVRMANVTLHIGLDTFRPIRSEALEGHAMHREWFCVPEETASAIAEVRRIGGRVVAVGTTVVRALESSARATGQARTDAGETNLFITPGWSFRAVDALITNFHLPKSTLLVLVSALAGIAPMRAVYAEAMRQRYRFYSYGDAMMIV